MIKKLIIVLCIAAISGKDIAATVTKPNVLWIVTDDQRADSLECWNNAVRGTSESELGFVMSPNVNELARDGVLFVNSFCNSPVCGPSRASMHMGMYPHHNGMFNFQLKHNEHDRARPLIPEIMRDKGYQATSFGKIGYYIYEYSKPMRFKYPDHYQQYITEREIERTGQGDQCRMEGTKNKKTGKIERVENWFYPDGTKKSYVLYQKEKEDTPDNSLKHAESKREMSLVERPGNQLIFGGQSTMPTEKTQDGVIASEFCSYLEHAGRNYTSSTGRKMRGPDVNQPQYIHVGFHFPHTPVLPSEEFRKKFHEKKYKLPDFEKWEVSKMPLQMQRWYKSCSVEPYTKEQQLQCISDYYAFCAMGDSLIGKVVEAFKRYCARNNQEYLILVVCGDNGWHLGEQGTYAKFTGFIKSNQTAVIAVSSDKKKFPSGKIVRDFVEFVDIAPTIYAAAGCNLNDKRFEYLDGRNLEDTASGKIIPRAYVIGETQVVCGHRAYLRGKDFAFSMRSRPYNGNPSYENPPNSNIKWALECTPEEAEMGLYDLRIDPKERNNVAYEKEYRDLAEWFRKKLGNIVLGDNRFEAIWDEKNVWALSSFAVGSDDKLLDIPQKIIPKINKNSAKK